MCVGYSSTVESTEFFLLTVDVFYPQDLGYDTKTIAGVMGYVSKWIRPFLRDTNIGCVMRI
jgi:hypothetical protein